MLPNEKQEKTSLKELNKLEASNIADRRFKTMVIRMLNKFRGRIDQFSENFNQEIVNIKDDAEIIKKNRQK